MHAHTSPTAVRLLGFPPGDAAQLGALLAALPRQGAPYACLHDDSLQEPDVVLADGANPLVPACLDEMRSLPPVLLLGGPPRADYTQIPAPPDPATLRAALGRLGDERRRTLAQLRARGEPLLAERRRYPRLAAPAARADGAARRQPPRAGKVLVVDKGGAFRDHLARLVDERALAVAWTDSAPTAVRLCDETAVVLALINTATPGIDPYDLSRAIKSQEGAGRTAVVLLVGRNFNYDSERAHGAGVRGLLDKPVADRCLLAALQRLAALPT